MLDIPKIAKQLASEDIVIRKKSLKFVKLLLAGKTANTDSINRDHLVGICKGLYYCLWMQDKLLLQEQVVTLICRIFGAIADISVQNMFVDVMFETLTREWDKLDKWRTDKFMMLVREFFVRALLKYDKMGSTHVNILYDAIFIKVLNLDIQNALGLKIHMCTIIGEEFKKKKIHPDNIINMFLRVCNLLLKLPKSIVYTTSVASLSQELLNVVKTLKDTPFLLLSEQIVQNTLNSGKNVKVLFHIARSLHVIGIKCKKQIPAIESKTALSSTGKKRNRENDIKVPSTEVIEDEKSIQPMRKKIKTNKSLVQSADLTVSKTPEQIVTKRVSFGKIFRKKFHSNKKLAVTPISKHSPARSILRSDALL